MKKAKINSTKQINRSYHSHLKTIIKGVHEKEIFDSLSEGKNSYLRLDRLASSSFDKSWIEVIEGCIFDLGTIIANPKMTTKVEGSLTPVELARKINNESVQHLASHTQFIKEIDEYGNVIPSKLLSMYADDDIHTYENRFIATFVRRLMLFITKRYEYVTKFAELRNEEYLYFKNKSIVDGAEVEIETKVKISYKNDDEEARTNSAYVDRIKQTRDYIMYFYNSPFMRAMKNEKDVRNPIMQTNIIRKNVKYHHCYEVYRFIETYDRLGVNYKIDENYSLFNDEELKELNRTLFANYITLKGKEMSLEKKTNTKTYKPRILTSAEDEAFIYGPLLEGPIEFARVDEGYQQYLESKLRKDLPLHPTKKEKEYYEDEYAAKSEFKQDQKQLADLLKRRQKEVNAFEKSVKNILIEREKARLRLIELEKETIRKEENDLLEAARREIIDAARKKDGAVNQAPIVEEKETIKEVPVVQEKIVYVSKVTFEDAAKEIWPQLNNPTPVVVEKVVEVPVEKPVEKVKEVPQPATEAKQEAKDIQVVLVPSVSFDDAVKDIWPQLDRPVVIKTEPKKASKVRPVENKVDNIPEEQQPVVATVATNEEENKEAHVALVPTVSFEEAANEVWPQLNNPTPIAVKEEPVIEQPAVAQTNKEQPKQVTKQEPALVPTVSFEDAANEIWPQLNNPKPLVKEEVKEQQPVVTKSQPKANENKRLIKVQFIREDGTVAIIYKKAPKQNNEVKVEQPKEVKETPKAESTKSEQPARASGKPLTYEDIISQIWPQLDNPQPVVKEQPKVDNNKPSIKHVDNRPQKSMKSKHSRKGFRK